MKKLIDTWPLNFEQINFLKTHCQPRLYHVPEVLVYSGQVPEAGYVLLEGKITFDFKNTTVERMKINSMICVPELLNNILIRPTIRIHPVSKVLILDKTSLFEITKSPQMNFLKTVLEL